MSAPPVAFGEHVVLDHLSLECATDCTATARRRRTIRLGQNDARDGSRAGIGNAPGAVHLRAAAP